MSAFADYDGTNWNSTTIHAPNAICNGASATGWS